MKTQLIASLFFTLLIFSSKPSFSQTSPSNLDNMTPGDKELVMQWIAQQVTNSKYDYCYRKSYGRGAGEPLSTCPQGTERKDLLCYTLCKSGYEGNGPVCWQNCPSGYRDDNATTCWKPNSYGRGAGYPAKVGEFNLDKARKRCADEHPEGCEKDGLVIYPKCKPGFTNAGCCICSPDCPPGMTNSGAGCIKQSYGRGAGKPMGCKDGLEKGPADLLCYLPCQKGYHGDGPVCWQNCISTQPEECGAGCATTKEACGQKTSSMVTAPIMLAVNILTLGESSEASAAKEELVTALKSRDPVAAKSALPKAMKAYALNFSKMTDKEVMSGLRSSLSQNAQQWVMNEFVSIQMKMTMEKDFSTEDLRDLAGLDPTGVAQVVEAYTQKICAKENPFPTLSRKY